VVQAGAYTEAAKLREARARIEQLGLKTYTQVVETDKGSRTRVRVGPYATRAEAEAIAGKVKQTGLQAAVLAL
jgi:DedD protein